MMTMTDALRKVLKRLHYPLDVMLTCVRWYVAYPLSLCHVEELMAERGVEVDHSTVHRWAMKILPILTAALRRHKRPVGSNWRMDETYIKVHGKWVYLYRAVDKAGDAIDFLLRARRDAVAARRCQRPARHPREDNNRQDIGLRLIKYLNNIVEHDHRAIKRIVRPMLGFKNFRCARLLIGGIETMHAIRKGQCDRPMWRAVSAANQFYSLAH